MSTGLHVQATMYALVQSLSTACTPHFDGHASVGHMANELHKRAREYMQTLLDCEIVTEFEVSHEPDIRIQVSYRVPGSDDLYVTRAGPVDYVSGAGKA